MSFSKAKLKRFNDVADPAAPTAAEPVAMDRKEQIKQFLRGNIRPGMSSEAESSRGIRSSLRMFRTPSLPKRLRFRATHTTAEQTPTNELVVTTPPNVTTAPTVLPKTCSAKKSLFHREPKDKEKDKATKEKKKSEKKLDKLKDELKEELKKELKVEEQLRRNEEDAALEDDKEALAAARVEIQNKTESLQECEQLTEELRRALYEMAKLNRGQEESLFEKDGIINDMRREICEAACANELLSNISAKSIEKIGTLENDIREIILNHENEVDFLIRTSKDWEMAGEKIKVHNEKLLGEILQLRETQSNLNALYEEKIHKISTLESELCEINTRNETLSQQLEGIRKAAENDLVDSAEEHFKLKNQFEKEKSTLLKENHMQSDLIRALQAEISDKMAELDSQKDDFNEEVKQLVKQNQLQIASIMEANELKVKEIESICLLEKTKLIREQQDAMRHRMDEHKMELERFNVLADEKVRISEIQMEEKLKALEHQLNHEKAMWKDELSKCQKIAETEIMQCEFEKTDLKTLLETANEMMKFKEARIEELEKELRDLDAFQDMRNDLQATLIRTKSKCAQIMEQKLSFEITLNNTRKTVAILMDRVRKSDSDVELLKMEVNNLNLMKGELEQNNQNLLEELNALQSENEELKNGLTALRDSSLELESRVQEQEDACNKVIEAEKQETVENVNQISKAFSARIDENMKKYNEMYNELKQKYEASETYVTEMKQLLDEFATGIELARMELDAKNKRLHALENENKGIKLENLQFRFKCEQLEKESIEVTRQLKQRDADEDFQSSAKMIENIINELTVKDEKDGESHTITIAVYNEHQEGRSDEEKIHVENGRLKEKLDEQQKQIELLKEMIEIENAHAAENMELRKKLIEAEERLQQGSDVDVKPLEKLSQKDLRKLKQMDVLRDTNSQLKTKISQLHMINAEQEATIMELRHQQPQARGEKTPRQVNNASPRSLPSTPKTPKKLFKDVSGKENRSPLMPAHILSPNVLRERN